jgi:hypothetical protein
VSFADTDAEVCPSASSAGSRASRQRRRWPAVQGRRQGGNADGPGNLPAARGVLRRGGASITKRRSRTATAAAAANTPRSGLGRWRCKTPNDLARARLGNSSRRIGNGDSATAIPSSLRATTTSSSSGGGGGPGVELSEAAAIHSLCAAFGGVTRLRSHECRMDRSSGFVRSNPELMPLPPQTEYTLHLINRYIGSDSVVTATVLPTPPPRTRRATAAQRDGSVVMMSTGDSTAASTAGARAISGNGKLIISSTRLAAGKVAIVVRNVSDDTANAAFRLSFSVFG